MSKQTVSRTALGAATCRLIEQYQPEKTRLFYDPVANALVGGPIRFLMQFANMRNLTIKQMDAVVKGLYGVQICRTRYIDDLVQAGISQGINQLAILGAGYDSRRRLPNHVSFIPINFDTQTLESVFSGTAFNSAEPALFIWEGVTQYISEESVRQTLAFVGKSAPKSIIVFTYVLNSIIERRSDIPDTDRLMDVVAKQSPWIFGLDSSKIPNFLKTYRLSLSEDVGNEDYQKRYLNPLKRNLAVFEGERIVQASVID